MGVGGFSLQSFPCLWRSSCRTWQVGIRPGRLAAAGRNWGGRGQSWHMACLSHLLSAPPWETSGRLSFLIACQSLPPWWTCSQTTSPLKGTHRAPVRPQRGLNVTPGIPGQPKQGQEKACAGPDSSLLGEPLPDLPGILFSGTAVTQWRDFTTENGNRTILTSVIKPIVIKICFVSCWLKKITKWMNHLLFKKIRLESLFCRIVRPVHPKLQQSPDSP